MGCLTQSLARRVFYFQLRMQSLRDALHNLQHDKCFALTHHAILIGHLIQSWAHQVPCFDSEGSPYRTPYTVLSVPNSLFLTQKAAPTGCLTQFTLKIRRHKQRISDPIYKGNIKDQQTVRVTNASTHAASRTLQFISCWGRNHTNLLPLSRKQFVLVLS